MARLHPTLALGTGESPQSYVSRLALLNGIDGARTFCTDMGLTFQGIIDGDADALTDLAELSGAPLATLRNNALRREDDGWRLHGERVLKVSLRRDRLYVCPACLAEDAANADIPASVAGYGRTVWLIDHVRTCAKHSVGLVEVAPRQAEPVTGLRPFGGANTPPASSSRPMTRRAASLQRSSATSPAASTAPSATTPGWTGSSFRWWRAPARSSARSPRAAASRSSAP